MGGQNNNRGRNRNNNRNSSGGRGGGRNNNQSNKNNKGNNKNTSKPKEKEYKFFPHTSGKSQQTCTYQAAKDHLLAYIQKTFTHGQDMAISLRDEAYMTFTPPVREEETSTKVWKDSNGRDREPSEREWRMEIMQVENRQRGKDIEYTAKLERHNDRVERLESNKAKAFSTIMANYCSTVIKSVSRKHRIAPQQSGMIQLIFSRLFGPWYMYPCKHGTHVHWW